MLCVVTEDTGRTIGERRLRTLRELAARTTDRPDAVLLDIGMPVQNGYDTARRMRELPRGKGLLLVAVTGRGQEEGRRRSREAGFDAHMVKPPDPGEVVKLLARLQPETS